MRPHAAAFVAGALLLTACSSGSGTSSGPPAPSTTSAGVPGKPAATTTDLLTGLPGRSTGRPVAVKIDNALLARPFQTGLGGADVVYEELVEGGSTRFLAVFDSSRGGAAEVGPVRSVRESDVDLLREFGGITVGFSGGNTGVVAIVNAAARKGYLVNASYDETPSSYRLGSFRRDARNFFVTPSMLEAKKPGAGEKDIGLRFGRGALTGGVPTTSAVARYSTQSAVTLTWTGRAWTVRQESHLMPGVAPVNIVVQRVEEHSSRFSDVHGMPTPYTVTTGSGAATVLTRGQRVAGRWVRDGFGATHFLDAAGHDVPLTAGPTWVLLVPTTGSLTLS